MVKIEGNAGPGIEPGRYTLKIGDSEFVDVRDFKDPDKMVQKVKITFTIVGDSDWDGTEFSDLFFLSDGKKSKLGQLARAALKVDDLPAEWDTEELAGKRILANVDLTESGYNRLVKDTINKIQAKPKPESKPEPAAETDDTWDEDTDAA